MINQQPTCGARTRIDRALHGRALALVVGDDDERRFAFLRNMHRRYAATGEYVAALVRVPDAGTDVQLLRAIARALALPATRTRPPMWRELNRLCAVQYRAGRRLLLLFDDVHLASRPMFDLLHLITTLTVADDLAVAMVLAGRAGLPARLEEDRHRALRSRVGASLKLGGVSARAARAIS